ncbi:NAD(P)-dependent alcohol dehydrogenase [Citricoccus sp. GCM10030269]|uniref:NAD(P)-dependent alcohol dehydrogenase n=1 Tax=Citricoccus sp. GCM10030269 TaxID=3273388 RepID=UPI0036133284
MSESSVMASVMTGLNQLEVQRIPHPVPGPNQVVVEIRSVGICGSDAAYLHHGRIGSWAVETPFILGHETSGVVVAVGSQAPESLLHQRVAVEPGSPCYHCRQCRLGRYHLCPDLAFLATPPHDGCLAERIAIHADCVFPIPNSMSFDQAAMVEPTSVGLWACRRAGVEPGDRVHVIGAGPVGILAGLVARTLGAGEVTINDVSEHRKQAAAGVGLEVTDEVSDIDVLLECSGSEKALVSALGRMAPGSRVALVGMSHQDTVGLPLPSLFPLEISFATVSRYAHTWPTVIQYISSRRIRVDELITHHFSLAETKRAFEVQSNEPSAVKVMIHPTADD